MGRKARVLGIGSAVLVTLIGGLAVAVSYDGACSPVPAAPVQGETMAAFVYRCYGGPTVLQRVTTARPAPGDSDVLVKIHAASVNPLDWHYLRGEPYVMRLSSGLGVPNDEKVGVDFAGTVTSVGRAVTRFKVGDTVFGGGNGAFAEYVLVKERGSIVTKPANISFEEAAAAGVAAVTALQALRDEGRVTKGTRVLINGASGGVGTYAVQIAKSLGAHVTGVCSSRNVELVQSLGADAVVDYTKRDFTTEAERFDVIIDNVGNHSLSALSKVLTPSGSVVIVGGPSDNKWIGPLSQVARAVVRSPFVGHREAMFLAEMNGPDLETLRDLLTSGTVRSVIDRRYKFRELADAITYQEQGRARGKVIITFD